MGLWGCTADAQPKNAMYFAYCANRGISPCYLYKITLAAAADDFSLMKKCKNDHDYGYVDSIENNSNWQV